ncbi:MAG: hypothetical protein COV44_09660 [Deltaproteobacteria bacterium CG11_big_fil_rev_8_21_14_0_20_45_16]|nr:MAG: hypothetical protein COV44_09660 [Deltaproteobacteria bacterium CG11_big_fil_rev_8_21_14_0_20_45_16]
MSAVFYRANFIFIGAVVLGYVAAVDVFAQEKPTSIEITAAKVYTPAGFDDNDVAQIILEGQFPNPCYRIKEVKLERLAQDEIGFRISAYQYEDICAQVMTPFMQVVDIGILDEGSYKIFDLEEANRDLRHKGDLPVAKATSRKRDSYIYAPVDSSYVVYKRDARRQITARYLALVGTFPGTCFEFENRIPISRTIDNVIEVLPIVLEQNLRDCPGSTPFTKIIEIPKHIPGSHYLFHIRTMSGNSFNRIDDLAPIEAIEKPRKDLPRP